MTHPTTMWSIFLVTTLLGFLTAQVASQGNDCGNTSFSGSEGVVTSPNFPLPYPHNVTCTYSIDVGRNNSVLLKFLLFDLESSMFSSVCTRDWLWIRCNETDGENLDFRNRFCGTDLPRTSLRFFDCPVVTMKFFADYSVNGGGFEIEYSVFDKANYSDLSDHDCGETEFTNSSGVITIPTNPTEYSARVNCNYTISSNNTNSRISVFVQSLQLVRLMDSFRDCNTEYIMLGCVGEGETELNPNTSRKLCQMSMHMMRFDEPLPFIFSSCRKLMISIRSFDYVYRGNGSMHFTVANNDNACATSTFTDPNGTIVSPHFPLAYPHSLNCFYSIDVDRTKSISLEFLSFKLEGRSAIPPSVMDDCSYDWLTVTCSSDSLWSNPSQNRKYCGDKTLAKPLTLLYSNCDSLTLNFVTDHSVSHGGFRIRYTITSRESTESPVTDAPYVDCGNTSFAGSSGIISSPRFPLSYPNNARCDYSIPVNRSQMAVLRFVSFSLEGVAHATFMDSCLNDWLMITVNGSACRASAYEGSEYGRSEYAHLGLDDYPYRHPGLRHGGLRHPSLRYPSLRRPDYDDSQYQNPFYDLLHRHSVPIHVGSHRNTKYCGEKAAPFLLGYSNCDSLTLHFITDSSVASGGFQLQYKITSADESDCGGTMFSGPNGVITSPKHPFSYPGNMSCAYSIDVGRSSFVLLKFKRFELEEANSTGDCNDWLMIRCNETTNPNQNINKKFCGSIQWNSSLRIVDCPSVLLEFVSDSSSNTKAGFVIEYTVIDNSNGTEDVGPYEVDCGATLFTNSSGVVNLPRNPKNYLTTVNCTYIISTNRSSYIWMSGFFSSSMQLMQSFPDCDTDRLTIGCLSEGGTKQNSNATLDLCRRAMRTSDLVSRSLMFEDCRNLKISIRSTNYDNTEPFSIPFSALGRDEVCGNTSFSDPSGVIYFPRLPWQYKGSVNCSFTIDSGHVNSVVLSLRQLSFGYLPTSIGSCSNGWLTIRCLVNGTSVPHPIADRKLCQLQSLTPSRFPACRSVTLNFFVNSVSYSTGFHLRYRIGDYDPECGNTSYSGPTGFITSPQFPLTYAHGLNCLYSITGAESSIISLSFLSFHLEGTSSNTSVDSCCCDWVTVSCFSDETAASNISVNRKYCGIKTTPLRFTFSNCPVVVLSFQSDTSVTGGGFKVRYAVRNTDSLCGVRDYGSPSGVIRFPWNDTDYGDSIDCNYAINATEASTISLTVWSINLQGSVERNCKSDWLLVTCVNGQTALDHKISHRSCDYLNSSTRLTFPNCAAASVVYHRDSESAGKTFRIEYAVTSNVEQTTLLSMTSISATEQVTAKTSCATGCKLSPEATHCDCLPATSQIPAVSVSTESPVTQSVKCGVGCKFSKDGTTCDCSTAHPGKDAVANAQISSSGRTVGISLTVILLVAGAICLAAFLLFRRRRMKNGSEMRQQLTEREVDTTKTGSTLSYRRNEEEDTFRYVPLRPMSIGDNEEHL